MIEVSVHIDEVSLARFQREMARRAELIGNGQKGIVEIAAVKLVTALRAGTVQSPKKRQIVDNPQFFQAKAELVAAGRTNRAAARAAKKKAVPFAVWYEYRKVKDGIPLFGGQGGSLLPLAGVYTKGDANRARQREIKRAGLAKRSWAWMLRGLGRSAGGGAPDVVGLTHSDLTFSRTGGGDMEATWLGTNRVRYMRRAMRRSISGSMHAAATMMRKESERLVARATEGMAA